MKEEYKKYNPRTLEQVCDIADYRLRVHDNEYCGLSFSRPIDCIYHAQYKDQNDLFKCLKSQVEETEQ